MLHFYIPDCLRDAPDQTADAITDRLLEKYGKVFNVNGMLPWVRTFIGQILSIESTSPSACTAFSERLTFPDDSVGDQEP